MEEAPRTAGQLPIGPLTERELTQPKGWVDTYPAPVKLYVVAGSYRQARDWAREYELGLEGRDWWYVVNAAKLRFVRGPIRVLRVGTCGSREDIAEIDAMLAHIGVIP